MLPRSCGIELSTAVRGARLLFLNDKEVKTRAGHPRTEALTTVEHILKGCLFDAQLWIAGAHAFDRRAQ